MNVLSKEKQQIVIGALAEGASIRSIERISGIHRDTVALLKSSRMEKGSKLGWPQFVNVVGQAQQESLFALSR